MRHIGGLARAIVLAGGVEINRESAIWIRQNGHLADGEVATTTPGQLPCRVLLHTVGPVWEGGSHGEEKKLISAVTNCLKEADAIGLSSLALPAISTG